MKIKVYVIDFEIPPRDGDEERMTDDEALDWDRIPVDERAAFVWRLSQEVYSLAHPDAPAEPGLSRSVVSLFRS